MRVYTIDTILTVGIDGVRRDRRIIGEISTVRSEEHVVPFASALEDS